MQAHQHLPLKNIKVVEFCQIAAGPFCGMLLADFGAQVIKVEPLTGDAMRTWPPLSAGPAGSEPYSENFASINRGKQSIALDLKNPNDLALARKLVLDADVLLENSRPGVMERLGLGWSWCHAAKPTLVYCSISAFGQDGPRGEEGGFDVTIQAAAGVMSVTGEPNGAPVKAGVPLADFASGLYAAYSIASALLQAKLTGKGAHIDVPMFAATLGMAALQTSEYFGTGTNPKKLGSAHPRNAPYQAYKASDTYFVIAAGNNKLWESVCDVTNLAHLVADERFTSPTLRAKNQIALGELLAPVFLTKRAQAWLDLFAAQGVPCAPINSYEQALTDPQAEHLGLVQAQKLPNGHKTKTVGSPIRFNGSVIPINTMPPALNAHAETLRNHYDGD